MTSSPKFLLWLLVCLATATVVASTNVVDEEWGSVTVLDAATARKPSRGPVGLWVNGHSAAADASFFDEEDAAFTQWKAAAIEEIKKKKAESKKDAAKAGRKSSRRTNTKEEGNERQAPTKQSNDEVSVARQTVAGVNARSTARRQTLESRTVQLDSKVTAVTVDLRSMWRRLQRSLGSNSNNTFSPAEDDLQSTALTYFSHALQPASLTLLDWEPIKNDSSVLDLIPNSGFIRRVLDYLYIRPSLPYPVVLSADVLRAFDMELDHLAADVRSLDKLRKGPSGVNASAGSANHIAALHDRIQYCQVVLRRHKDHCHQLLQATAPFASNQISMLREAASNLKKLMLRNDESTREHRQQLKQQTKTHKLLYQEIVQWEQLNREARNVQNRRALCTSPEVLKFALEQQVVLRRGETLDTESTELPNEDAMAVTALNEIRGSTRDVALRLIGLSRNEVKTLVAIPLLSSIVGCWVLSHVVRFVTAMCIALSSRLRGAGRSRAQRVLFGWIVKGLRLLVNVLHVLLSNTMLAVIAPLVCVTWFDGAVLNKEGHVSDLGLPRSLWYRAAVCVSLAQRLFIFAAIIMTIGTNLLLGRGGFLDRAQVKKTAGGKRLGSK